MNRREQHLYDLLKCVIDEESVEVTRWGVTLTTYITKTVAETLAHHYRANGASVAFTVDQDGFHCIVIDTEEIILIPYEMTREFSGE